MADARLLEFLVASQTIRELLSLVVALCILPLPRRPKIQVEAEPAVAARLRTLELREAAGVEVRSLYVYKQILN